MLCISGTVDYIIKILIMISTSVFLYLKKKRSYVNTKIILFFLAHFNSFLNNYLFFKFTNKCQKEILRCAPSSLHVCDFYLYWITWIRCKRWFLSVSIKDVNVLSQYALSHQVYKSHKGLFRTDKQLMCVQFHLFL